MTGQHLEMNQTSGSIVINFSVSGVPFATLLSTLHKETNSRLTAIARGSCLGAPRDATGAYFLDRDPKHFQLILNWLRDGWCALPRSSDERAELLAELQYYQLHAMEAWVRSKEPTAAASSTTALSQHFNGSPQRNIYTSGAGHQATGWPRPAPVSPRPPTRLQEWPHAGVSPQPHTGAGLAAAARPVDAWQAPSPASARQASLREAFLQATAAGPMPVQPAAAAMPTVLDGDTSKWTSRYMQTNEGVHRVVRTLLELAYSAPHAALQAGKVSVSVDPGPCEHNKPGSLVGGSQAQLRSKHQVVTVRNTSTGWSMQFDMRPGCDLSLFEKYSIADFVQDNWFMLTAVLKDQFGVVMTEEAGLAAGGLQCNACRRTHLAVSLQKIF
ncbi:hypothetical protein V8C86DRAFT_502207 [Haematococcus lacustris]